MGQYRAHIASWPHGTCREKQVSWSTITIIAPITHCFRQIQPSHEGCMPAGWEAKESDLAHDH